jgi:signal transduction histidine kinase
MRSPSSATDVPLEAVLCTEELNRRPARPPGFERENRALVALAQALADSPRTILQAFADRILEVFESDSAGISLVTEDGKRFYWPAIAGVWKPHLGGGTPRDFGPCGDVLDRGIPLMFRHFERRYTYLQAVMPPAEECLLVPFYVEGRAVGTIWAITHDDRRKFDAEDMRQLVSLGRFASSAYQAVESLGALERQSAEIKRLNEELEQRVVERTSQLTAASEALREAQAQLAHVTRVTTLGEVTASFAHELNQPLAAIANNANACLGLLPSGRHDLDEVREALADIVGDTERASAIIERVRGLARRSPPEKRPLQLVNVVADVVFLAAAESVARGVAIRTDVAAELPVVLGDRVQLQQVLLNLIVNGMDAMGAVAERGRVLEIRGRPDRRDGSPVAQISVQDRGVGLDAGQMERLFEAFYTTKPHGIGMGLAISRSIIEAHGGRLWVESNQGPGATFSFSLPAAAPSEGS